MDLHKQWFAEGRQAHAEGKLRRDNPYVEFTQAHKQWLRGWIIANGFDE